MSVELILILMFFVVLPLIQQLVEAARKRGEPPPEPGPRPDVAPGTQRTGGPPPAPRPAPGSGAHEPRPVPPPVRTEAPPLPGPVGPRVPPMPRPAPHPQGPRPRRPETPRPVPPVLAREPLRPSPPEPRLERLTLAPQTGVTRDPPSVAGARPQTRADRGGAQTSADGLRSALRDPAVARHAFVLMAILGPCRANEPHDWQ